MSGCGSRPRPRWERSPVVVLKARDYSANLVDIISRGLSECGLDVRGKRVLIKPNLVEFSPDTVINTNPAFIAAVAEVVARLGAASVAVGEGPGHRRDTMGMAEEAGYFSINPALRDRFIDLNRDEVDPVNGFGTLGRFWLPRTVLAADLIISAPKLKTHHWAGVTLSMKNLFGLVPGSLYGWPKNILHQHGIPESIAALVKQFAAKSFAIVDGIVGMEGNGPIQGKPKAAGVVVMGSDLLAVDATCCRIMDVVPERLRFLQVSEGLGWIDEQHIEQRGERIDGLRTRFELMPMWASLRGG